jgi:hypothetical protein
MAAASRERVFHGLVALRYADVIRGCMPGQALETVAEGIVAGRKTLFRGLVERNGGAGWRFRIRC